MDKKTNFNTVFNSFILLIPVNIFAISAMILYRIFLFLYFADFSAFQSVKPYILKAFVMGFRFDLAILSYINIPVTLFLLICLILRFKTVFNLIAAFFKYYYTVIFSLTAFAVSADIGFFSYFKDHFNFLVFGLFEDDTASLIKIILSDYRFYILTAVFLIICVLIYMISDRTYKQLKDRKEVINTQKWNLLYKFIFVISVLALNFLCARGTFGIYPLGLFHSQISPDYFINKLCINPLHPLADTIYYKIKNSNDSVNLTEIFRYKANPDDFRIMPAYKNIENCEDILIKKTDINEAAEKIKPNVVLIIMEGFGEMPVLYNSPQFDVLGELKQHFDEDTVFYNFLAAGSMTPHAVETLLLNIPQRPFTDYISHTENVFNKYPTSSVLPYKKAGYETISLYAGSLSWRNLDTLFRNQDFDKILSEKDAKDVKPEEQHAWGITNPKFFEMLNAILNDTSSGKPKFIYSLTTDPHPPYKVPKNYKPLPLQIPADIASMMSSKDLQDKALFESYQNANRELAKFLKNFKNSKLAENTIIAVVGDHGVRELSNYSSEYIFLRYAVPFYLYIPKQLKPEKINTSVLGSHSDILPTLYSLSLSDISYSAFGNNLFTAKDNIISNLGGLVMQNSCAILYNFTTNGFDSFAFNKETKKLEQTDKTEKHMQLANYYKTMLITCDKYIKQNFREVKK